MLKVTLTASSLKVAEKRYKNCLETIGRSPRFFRSTVVADEQMLKTFVIFYGHQLVLRRSGRARFNEHGTLAGVTATRHSCARLSASPPILRGTTGFCGNVVRSSEYVACNYTIMHFCAFSRFLFFSRILDAQSRLYIPKERCVTRKSTVMFSALFLDCVGVFS